MVGDFITEDVKTRLILAGLTELEEYGVKDFSLRRAALAAGVSCAAPYRYFKSKEDYISKIFSYLASKWELLFSEIFKAEAERGAILVTELCMANIGFWLANSNLRSALLLSGNREYIRISDFDKSLCDALKKYFEEKGQSEDDALRCANAVRAELYGYVTLIGAGELPNTPETLSMIREELSSRF